jgi:hypothetical protein
MGKVKDEDSDTGEAEWKSWQIDQDKLTTEIIASHEKESITMDAGKKIQINVGKMHSSPRETMGVSDINTTVLMSEKILYGFNKKMVAFNVGGNARESNNVIMITSDMVTVSVGDSILVLNASGKVEILGKDVEINAQSSFTVNATSVDINASGTANYTGSMINHKAGMIKQGKGAGKPPKPAKPPKGPKVESAEKPESKKNPSGGGGGGI